MLLNVVKRVLEKGSLLIFDAGANTKGNKKRIRGVKHHYLTRKPKKVKTYRKYVRLFVMAGEEERQRFEINEREKKGNKLLKKARKHKAVEKYPTDKGWIELYP
jgi:transposase